MSCQDIRALLLEYGRGQLPQDLHRVVQTHLAGCEACAHADKADRKLTEMLEQRLPQYPAPLALKRRLAEAWPSTAFRRASRWTEWRRGPISAFAAAAMLLLALVPLLGRLGLPENSGRIVSEAVNDHLRILSSQHPLDLESAAMHQVIPWFEGRLDFTPVVRFPGDQEFPVRGGAVGYFLDRKAAVLVFERQLHVITLIVFRAKGLPLPTDGLIPLGDTSVSQTAARGFNLVMWREGELGYVLVSDVNARELTQLAAKLCQSGD